MIVVISVWTVLLFVMENSTVMMDLMNSTVQVGDNLKLRLW